MGRKVIIGLIIFSVLSIAIFVVYEWPTIERGEICEQNEYTKQKDCTQYKALSFIFIKIVKTLDHHEGTVVGIATIALALFTWRLWWSTERLVHGGEDTAKRQLRAYMAFDYLLPSYPIDVRISNYGKTPAHDIIVTYDILQSPPKAKPSRGKESSIIHLGTFAPSQFYNHNTRIDWVSKVSDEFWLHGMIKYLDIFDYEWIVYFCHRYKLTDHGYTSEAYPDYNYQECKGKRPPS